MDKIIDTPLVSVIMPAYNAALYIEEAIDSVILQSFSNWELIIINDGSTDATADIIAEKTKKDSRIKCINQQNKRQSKARNFGISCALGTYIAFLDADDSILPDRFAKQVAFLESNNEIILCGSWFKIMNSDRVIQLPEKHEDIKLALLLGNCFANSSVMVKKQILDELLLIFDNSKEPAEDYDLWARLIFKGKLHNLQEVLLSYRTHSNQLSNKQNIIQKQSAFETKRNLFNLLELDLMQEERLVLDKIIKDGVGLDFTDIAVFKKLQQKLLDSNSKKIFVPEGFKKLVLELEKQIVKRCFITVKSFSPKTYFNYLKIKKQLKFKLSILEEIKLIVKSMFLRGRFNHN